MDGFVYRAIYLQCQLKVAKMASGVVEEVEGDRCHVHHNLAWNKAVHPDG